MGSGQSGMADGDIHQVQFDSPRGLAEYNNCIYIADTNNHAIRVVRIRNKFKREQTHLLRMEIIEKYRMYS